MNASDVRKAHKLLDYVSQGRAVLDDEIKLLRSFLPELPAQKTLEELRREVYDVWAGTNGNEWPDDMYCDLENWLYKLHKQLRGLEPANPAHPEFLETAQDYEDAPMGTVVAYQGQCPWARLDDGMWTTAVMADMDEPVTSLRMGEVSRRVLRWGWGE